MNQLSYRLGAPHCKSDAGFRVFQEEHDILDITCSHMARKRSKD